MTYFGAIRAATTTKENSSLEIEIKTERLFKELFEQNKLEDSEIISVILTITGDLTKLNPAKVLREKLGLNSTALVCMQEARIEGGLPLCIRALVHVNFKVKRDIKHIYQEEARFLRKDWL